MNTKAAMTVILALTGCLIYLHSRTQFAPQTLFLQTAPTQTPKARTNSNKPSVRPLSPSFEFGTTAHPQASLHERITREAKHLYDLNDKPNDTETRLKIEAQALSESQISELGEIAMNEHGDSDERTIAVYMLTLTGSRAQQTLLQIFMSPAKVFAEPAAAHSIKENQRQREYALRTMALEAVEFNLHRTDFSQPLPVSVGDFYLNGLLKIVKLGQLQHHPILKDFINQQLSQDQI